MAVSLEEIQQLLNSLEEGSATDNLVGRSLVSKDGQNLFLTHIPGSGPGLLIYPTSENNKSLKKISLRGVEIRNVNASINGESEKQYLGVLCRDISPKFKEPFMRLTEDLVINLERAGSDSATVLRDVLNKWRYFWAPVEHDVTEEWIKGLWGELYLLEQLIERFGTTVIVHWTGPEGMDHDFQGGGIGVEVKTTETVPPVMTVNNIRQLDSAFFESLFVAVCLVSRSEKGLTLDQLMDSISRKLYAEPDLAEIFLRKISAAGYRPQHGDIYKALPLAAVRPPLWYRVDDSFPSITSRSFTSPLDSRIRDIRYRVELSNIKEADTGYISSAIRKMSGIS